MKKIEMIVKEMKGMIKANGLDVSMVTEVLNDSENHNINILGEWEKWEKIPTTFTEMRELMKRVTYRTVESAFNSVVLDKDEVRELWAQMDDDNQSNFIFRAWQTILNSRNIKTAWEGKLAKNYEKLFDNEDLLVSFKGVVIEIAGHYN